MENSNRLAGFSGILAALYQSAKDPLAWTEFNDALADFEEGTADQNLLNELTNHINIAGDLVQEPQAVHEEKTSLQIVFDHTLCIRKIFPEQSASSQISLAFPIGSCLFEDDPLVAERLHENILRLIGGMSSSSIIVMPASIGFSVGLVLPYNDNEFRLILIHDGEQRSLTPVLEAFATLTPTEKRIGKFLYNGSTLKQIASELSNSENTIKTHIQSIFAKIGTRSQKDLIHVFEIVGQIGQQHISDVATSEHFQQLSNPAREILIDELHPKQTISARSGRRVAYREYGAAGGHPVLCLHGLYGCSRLSSEQIRLICDHGLRVVALDRAGYGDTSPISNSGDIGEALDDFLHVANTLNLRHFDILGFGIGAFFALALGSRAADRVQHIYLCAPGFGAGLERPSARSPMQFVLALARRRPGTIEAILKLIVRRRTRKDFERSMLKMLKGSEPDLAASRHPDLIDHLWCASHESIAQGTVGFANDILTTRKTSLALDKLSVPLTIWRGAHDKMENTEQLRSHLSVVDDLEFNVLTQRGQLLFHTDFQMIAERISAARPL